MKSSLRVCDEVSFCLERIHNADMRRTDREVKDIDEIVSMIAGMDTIRIAMNAGEGPYIVPLSFGYEERSGAISFYMHSALTGRKIDMVKASSAAGFELDKANGLVSGKEACAFSMRYESVIGTGRISIVEDTAEKLHGMCRIMEHYTGRYDWDIPEAALSHAAVLRLDVLDISAKRY